MLQLENSLPVPPPTSLREVPTGLVQSIVGEQTERTPSKRYVLID